MYLHFFDISLTFLSYVMDHWHFLNKDADSYLEQKVVLWYASKMHNLIYTLHFVKKFKTFSGAENDTTLTEVESKIKFLSLCYFLLLR